MLRLPFRRSFRSRFARALLLVLVLIVLIDFFSLVAARKKAQSITGPANVQAQKLFISSIHWNNEAILRSHWNQAVVDLAGHFGAKNIYVSIFESGSWDDSKGALRLLDSQLEQLGVRRKIVLDTGTHANEINAGPGDEGWIETPRGTKELRRIPYLSRLRNQSLQPLVGLVEEGMKFDKILFLNDVVFNVGFHEIRA